MLSTAVRPARCYHAGTMSMRRLLAVLLIALPACTVGYVPPPAGPARPSVSGHPDMTGWRLMGDGRVARVMLVITDNSLEVGDVVIQFGNGQRWSPGLRNGFADGSRSRAIDLPGHVRFIRGVELVRGSVPPGANAHVELWGQ